MFVYNEYRARIRTDCLVLLFRLTESVRFYLPPSLKYHAATPRVFLLGRIGSGRLGQCARSCAVVLYGALAPKFSSWVCDAERRALAFRECTHSYLDFGTHFLLFLFFSLLIFLCIRIRSLCR